MKCKPSFINIVIILCLLVSLSMASQFLLAFIEPNFLCSFLILIPLMIFVLLKKFSIKFKWNLTTTNILTLLLIPPTLLFFLIIEGVSHIQYSPSRLAYESSLNTLKKHEGAERLAHFPNKIPTNAKNYFMQIEHSFDGYNMNYVNFDIDKAYIDNTFKTYEKGCKILGTYRKLYDSGERIYLNSLDDKDKICILKKSSEDEHYTSGLIFKNESPTIYFFYSNF